MIRWFTLTWYLEYDERHLSVLSTESGQQKTMKLGSIFLLKNVLKRVKYIKLHGKLRSES